MSSNACGINRFSFIPTGQSNIVFLIFKKCFLKPFLFQCIYICVCISAIHSYTGQYTENFTDSAGYGHLRYFKNTCAHQQNNTMSTPDLDMVVSGE